MHPTSQRSLAVIIGMAVILMAAPLLSVCAQAEPHAIKAKFDTATGLLLIPVAVDGTTFWCSLDTGFSALFSFDEHKIGRANLFPAAAHPTPDGRPPTPGDREARAVLEVGGVVLRDQNVIVRAFSAAAPDTECVMGVGLIRDYVVEFDYAVPEVRLYNREEFDAGSNATAIPLDMRRNSPFVEVDVRFGDGSSRHVSVVVDTGASYYSLGFVNDFVERNHIDSLVRTARPPQSFAATGILSARVSEIAVGPWRVADPVIALLEPTTRFGSIDDGLLGSGFLQRFTVAMDFAGSRMYLTPNKRYGTPQLFDAGGVGFRQTSDPAGYEVKMVIQDSAAARAGVHPGDRLLKVNGQAIDAITPIELRDLFSQPGATLNLQLSRGGRPVTATVRLVTRL